jgi:hypothetical protein
VTQGVGSEFKPQYHTHTKKKNKENKGLDDASLRWKHGALSCPFKYNFLKTDEVQTREGVAQW